MTKTLSPNSVEEIIEIVAKAASDKSALRILGGGSKLGLGNEVPNATLLSTSKLSGIIEFKPDALSLVVQAGTPMATIEKALAKDNQRLSFEPADYRSLFGTQKTTPTIGGVTACNISGPRRLAVGACRDMLLGVKFINGQGELIKNGGKVMKNVTGYDLVKFLCGSYGTLGILTELSFKTAPLPASETTLAFSGLSDAQAISLFADLLGQPLDITGTLHATDDKSWLRIEGFPEAVSRRIERIRGMTDHSFDLIEGAASRKVWQSLCNLEFASNASTLWKLTLKPSDGPALIDTLKNLAGGTAHYDWAGARVWYQPDSADHNAQIRALTNQAGGYAMLVKGEKSVEAFHPQPDILARMSENIRAKFDPHAIFNPGLMVQQASE